MKKIEMINIFELDKNTMDELYLENEKEMDLYEGDPDYYIDKNGNVEFFTLYNNKCITSDYDIDGNIEKFIENDPKRKFMDKQNRDNFSKCKNPKIAFRNGVGYIYRLYEYVD